MKCWYSNILKKYKTKVKFIQISTDEIYRSSSKYDELIFDENFLINHGNPYSAIIIRSSNNYGKNQNKEKLIPKVIKKL